MNNLQQFTDYVYRFPDCNSCEETLKIMQLKIELIDRNELEFDLIGLKPYIANALRQTILNDVPTMAVEDIYFNKNSTLFNCDYIAQRLALIPIKANPDNFKFVYNSSMEHLNSDNAIVLRMDVKNTGDKSLKVYSNSLVWEPIGSRQLQMDKIEPLFVNIPILYLKPGEEILCNLHCIKGTGRSHMKFSPGFASYYFHSQINIKDQIMTPEVAMKVTNSFPSGVIETTRRDGNLIPYVSNARLDRHSRSFKNDESVSNCVDVKYYRDHLIFSVESYGLIEPIEMVTKSLDIMIYKYNNWMHQIKAMRIKLQSAASQ